VNKILSMRVFKKSATACADYFESDSWRIEKPINPDLERQKLLSSDMSIQYSPPCFRTVNFGSISWVIAVLFKIVNPFDWHNI